MPDRIDAGQAQTRCLLPGKAHYTASGFCCATCQDDLAEQLRDVEAWLFWAAAAGIYGTPLVAEPVAEYVTGSRERPLPGGALLSLVGPAAEGTVTTDHPEDQDPNGSPLAVLAEWCTYLAEKERLTVTPGRFTTVSGCVDFLTRHLGTIVQREWVGQFARELKACHDHLRRLPGLGGEQDPSPVGACPRPTGATVQVVAVTEDGGPYLDDDGQPILIEVDVLCEGNLYSDPHGDGVRCVRNRSHHWTPDELEFLGRHLRDVRGADA